jgi:hypothetical protein
VATPQLRRFTLVVDPLAEPIAGRLEDERASGRDFIGWLGLATALEALLSTRPAEGQGPGPDDPNS